MLFAASVPPKGPPTSLCGCSAQRELIERECSSGSDWRLFPLPLATISTLQIHPLRCGRNEPPEVAGPHNKTGDAPPALTAQAGSDGPTARARAEGKRGPRTPALPRCMRGGERLAPEIGQSSVYGAAMRSLHAAPLPCEGEGEDAEGGVLPSEKHSHLCRRQPRDHHPRRQPPKYLPATTHHLSCTLIYKRAS